MTNEQITSAINELEDSIKVNKEYMEGLEKDIAALQEKLKKPQGLWKPKLVQNYWAIHGDKVEMFVNSGQYLDDNYIIQGNYYQTEEEAKKELDKRIALQEMREYIAEKGIGWKGKGMKGVQFIDKEGKVNTWYASEGLAV